MTRVISWSFYFFSQSFGTPFFQPSTFNLQSEAVSYNILGAILTSNNKAHRDFSGEHNPYKVCGIFNRSSDYLIDGACLN